MLRVKVRARVRVNSLLAGGIMYPLWLGSALGSPRNTWTEECQSSPSKSVDSATRP